MEKPVKDLENIANEAEPNKLKEEKRLYGLFELKTSYETIYRKPETGYLKGSFC